MSDVNALLAALLIGISIGVFIGWWLHSEVRPALALWIDRRDARGR